MIQFMKTGLRLFALCATLLASLTVKAQISKSWHYYTNEGVETQWGGQGCAYGLSFQDNNDGVNTITVYGYTKGADANVNTNIHLVIPEKVVENGVTYTVTRIDNETTAEDKGVFASTYDIQSVIVPNTVTTIGADAFWSCAGLQEISLGNSVTTIGDNAFQYCAALRSISLPNTLTSVGNHFLCHCNKIEALVIPENLVTIGNYFLHGCESLRDVYLMGSNYRSLGQYPFCSQAQQHDQQVHDCTFWVESEAIYHSNYENYGNWHNADASFTGSYDASCDGTYTNQGNHYAWKGKDEKPLDPIFYPYKPKWTTACFPTDVDVKAEFGDGAKAAILTSAEYDKKASDTDPDQANFYHLYFELVEPDANGRVIMKANTPYLLQADPKNSGSAYIVKVSEEDKTRTDEQNSIKVDIKNDSDDPSAEKTEVRMLGTYAENGYHLGKGEFFFSNPDPTDGGDYNQNMKFYKKGSYDRVIPTYRCYWQIIKDGTQDVKAKLGISFDDNETTTGIQITKRNQQPKDHRVYNLQGQCFGVRPLSELPAGIYIVNGKKIIKH